MNSNHFMNFYFDKSRAFLAVIFPTLKINFLLSDMFTTYEVHFTRSLSGIFRFFSNETNYNLAFAFSSLIFS